MSSTPDLGPLPQRITVDAEQVRRLIGDQFPHWAHLPIQPVAKSGWDNMTFHLGDAMVARLPSTSEYALAVAKEQRWLPALAPRLPLPIPVPMAKGLAGFLAALQSVDAADGPQPGKHNWFRGATPRTYDAQSQRALTALNGHIDTAWPARSGRPRWTLPGTESTAGSTATSHRGTSCSTAGN